MALEHDALKALQSIDATLKELLALSKTKRAAAPAATVAAAAVVIAPDSDLDSEYGDEQIRFDPRDWTGTTSYKGCRMSECSAEYLDVIALVFTDLAKKNDLDGKEYKGMPQSTYDKRTAARARGWAARMRAGWKPKVAEGMPSW